MRSLLRFLPLLAAFALTGCTRGSAPELVSETDPGANISAWSTFGWQPPATAEAAEQPMSMVDSRIREAISTELTRRGYREVAADPQFLVAYEITAQEKVKSNPFRIGVGVGSYGGGSGGSVNVGSPSATNFREGQLSIHAVDAAARKEVWYGRLTGELGRKGFDAEAINGAVATAMQSFPMRKEALP